MVVLGGGAGRKVLELSGEKGLGVGVGCVGKVIGGQSNSQPGGRWKTRNSSRCRSESGDCPQSDPYNF